MATLSPNTQTITSQRYTGRETKSRPELTDTTHRIYRQDLLVPAAYNVRHTGVPQGEGITQVDEAAQAILIYRIGDGCDTSCATDLAASKESFLPAPAPTSHEPARPPKAEP